MTGRTGAAALAMLAGAAMLAVPMAARAGPYDHDPVVPGSGVVEGTPIILHNALHYKQEADRLYADYRKALARDGGRLSEADRTSLDARYASLATRVNRWIADGQEPTRLVGSNIARRSYVTSIGRYPQPLPTPPVVAAPAP